MDLFLADRIRLIRNSLMEEHLSISLTDNNCVFHDKRTGTVDAVPSQDCSSIHWNPFIPYWIGSLRSDSLDVFDLRYSLCTPMRHYKHPLASSMAWSNANCDLMIAAGSDRSVSLYSLEHGSRAIECVSTGQCGGPIVCCTQVISN